MLTALLLRQLQRPRPQPLRCQHLRHRLSQHLSRTLRSTPKNGNGPPKWAILTLLFLGGGIANKSQNSQGDYTTL
jgi:hypothetical protein